MLVWCNTKVRFNTRIYYATSWIENMEILEMHVCVLVFRKVVVLVYKNELWVKFDDIT